MGSTVCVQGQAEGLREQLVLVPISEGIPQDVLESFGMLESQEDLQDLHLAPEWEQSTQLYSGEVREFLPSHLGDLDWSSRERSLSGCLVQSLVSGFAIHLRIVSGPLPSIDATRSPHQVSHLQQVHISRVLRQEREREDKEKGVCT